MQPLALGIFPVAWVLGFLLSLSFVELLPRIELLSVSSDQNRVRAAVRSSQMDKLLSTFSLQPPGTL